MSVKITNIAHEKELEQRERKGFVSACRYGTIKPEKNEIGGIFMNARNARVEHGLVVHDAECVERIFLASDI